MADPAKSSFANIFCSYTAVNQGIKFMFHLLMRPIKIHLSDHSRLFSSLFLHPVDTLVSLRYAAAARRDFQLSEENYNS